jgi:hypothetical protein
MGDAIRTNHTMNLTNASTCYNTWNLPVFLKPKFQRTLDIGLDANIALHKINATQLLLGKSNRRLVVEWNIYIQTLRQMMRASVRYEQIPVLPNVPWWWQTPTQAA